MLSDITFSTAAVSWMHPDGTVTNFRVQYKFHSDDWIDAANLSVPGSMTSVTLIDLSPESSYNVRVLTENSLGSSEFGPEATFTTPG